MNLYPLLLLLLLASCQSAYIIKADQLPGANESSLGFSFKTPEEHAMSVKELVGDKSGLVAIFWQTGCPCVKRYQERINELSIRYGKDIAFVHISSNQNENFSKVYEEYKKRSVPLLLVRDEGGVFANRVGAKGTPAALLIDRRGAVRFMGWIDNERAVKESGREAYLENAINDFLAKEPIKKPTSPMFGCAIK